jgi:hypothetical protein
MKFYPSLDDNGTDALDVAAHPTLDPNVPDVAISSFDFQDPYTAMDNATARGNRLAYYSSVSWMDHQVGQVLDKLEALGQKNKTVSACGGLITRIRSRPIPLFLCVLQIVLFHADHGWNLGGERNEFFLRCFVSSYPGTDTIICRAWPVAKIYELGDGRARAFHPPRPFALCITRSQTFRADRARGRLPNPVRAGGYSTAASFEKHGADCAGRIVRTT